MNSTRYTTTLPRNSQTSAATGVATRCHACQLQLCKSRDQSPHAALERADPQPETVNGKPRKTSDAVYACQTCGTGLVHSIDRNEPGWRKFVAAA